MKNDASVAIFHLNLWKNNNKEAIKMIFESLSRVFSSNYYKQLLSQINILSLLLLLSHSASSYNIFLDGI